MAEVRIENVTKIFNNGEVVAVKDLSLTINDGEFLVLLGPSGCGKTTTLRMVAGLETQTEGDIFIGDRRVNELRAGDRDIAFVFQFYALYPHLTVRDNISFPLRAQNLAREEVDQRVNDVARRLRIDHILSKRPNRLPGGEQQRVALGRAMVRQPQVFLMDEPLTNLDASLRADMRVELKHLQQELATTMIYVTHDQVEAMSMSHRIAIMHQGVLQQVDTPLNVYRYPQTLFVATFIGSPPMNTVTGQVRGGAVISTDGAFRYMLPAPVQAGLKDGQAVVFGVRSEDVSVAGSEDEADVQGEVIVREPLGDETIYAVEIGGQRFSIKTAPRLRYQRGDHIPLKFNTNRLHLFDADGGQSLLKREMAAHV